MTEMEPNADACSNVQTKHMSSLIRRLVTIRFDYSCFCSPQRGWRHAVGNQDRDNGSLAELPWIRMTSSIFMQRGKSKASEETKHYSEGSKKIRKLSHGATLFFLSMTDKKEKKSKYERYLLHVAATIFRVLHLEPSEAILLLSPSLSSRKTSGKSF